jgi:hypothetical protein
MFVRFILFVRDQLCSGTLLDAVYLASVKLRAGEQGR